MFLIWWFYMSQIFCYHQFKAAPKIIRENKAKYTKNSNSIKLQILIKIRSFSWRYLLEKRNFANRKLFLKELFQNIVGLPKIRYSLRWCFFNRLKITASKINQLITIKNNTIINVCIFVNLSYKLSILISFHPMVLNYIYNAQNNLKILLLLNQQRQNKTNHSCF